MWFSTDQTHIQGWGAGLTWHIRLTLEPPSAPEVQG